MVAVNSKANLARRCIQTAHHADKSKLVRFVRTPDGGVVADLTGKLPGRGAYIIPEKQAIYKALKSGKLAHHLSKNAGPVTIDADAILANLSSQVSNALVAKLTLLRRAGRLVIGRMKIAEMQCEAGLLVADDASKRETQALKSKLEPLWVEENIPSEILGQTASRDSVAYAGVRLLDQMLADEDISEDEISAHCDDKMVSSLRMMITLWREVGVHQDAQHTQA